MVEDKREKRILLVEDERGDALLVRKILGKKNRDWMVLCHERCKGSR